MLSCRCFRSGSTKPASFSPTLSPLRFHLAPHPHILRHFLGKTMQDGAFSLHKKPKCPTQRISAWGQTQGLLCVGCDFRRGCPFRLLQYLPAGRLVWAAPQLFPSSAPSYGQSALLWGQSTDFFRSGGIWPARNAVRRRKIGTSFFPGSSGWMLSFPVSCPFPDICQGSANIKSPVQTELHGAFIQAFSFALGSGIARCIKHSPDHLHRVLRDCACSEPR